MKEKFGIRQFIIYVVVILLTLSCLIPLMNVISLSFSSSQAVASNKVGLWPEEFTFAAYEKIINDGDIGISIIKICEGISLKESLYEYYGVCDAL